MKSIVQKWGNSLAIRIPLAMAQECHIEQGTSIDIFVENKKMVIKPLKKKMNLSHMLDEINESNLHTKIEVADFLGKENLDD